MFWKKKKQKDNYGVVNFIESIQSLNKKIKENQSKEDLSYMKEIYKNLSDLKTNSVKIQKNLKSILEVNPQNSEVKKYSQLMEIQLIKLNNTFSKIKDLEILISDLEKTKEGEFKEND